MSSIDTDTTQVEEVQDTSALDYFLEEWNAKLKKDQLVCDWHVGLHINWGIELPWQGNRTTVYCTQEDYDRETRTSTVNVEKTRVILSKVVKYAVSLGYNVVKPTEDEDDDEYQVVVTISNEPEVKVIYVASRTVVCTPIKKKVYKPAELRPATFEEKTVGYECEKISFLAYNTDDES